MQQKERESKIETYLKKRVHDAGGMSLKFKSTVNGVPDQLILYKSNMYFVEVKRPGQKPRANQVHMHNKIQNQGIPVYNVDTKQTVDDFLYNILGIEPQRHPVPKTTTEQKTVTIQTNMFPKL